MEMIHQPTAAFLTGEAEARLNEVPLCVDFDCALIRTRSRQEALITFLRSAPWRIFQVLWWLCRGPEYLVERLRVHNSVKPELLPYSQPVLDLITRARKGGQRVILLASGHLDVARGAAKHLGLFDEIIPLPSEAETSWPERFQNGYDYVGDGAVDSVIRKRARRSVLANPRPDNESKALASGGSVEILGHSPSTLSSLLHELRPHQWIKNVLVFVPLVAAHSTKVDDLKSAFILFIAWCAMASCIYVLNDLLDLEADRRHPRKCRRPLASGELPILTGVLAAPILGAIGLALAAALNGATLIILIVYGVSSLAYSAHLKKYAILDAFLLAALYTIRVIGGWTATNLQPSIWLLAFVSFLFLGLAFLKRCAEMGRAHDNDLAHNRRGYRRDDLPVIRSFGIVSGFLSSLVLALYVQSAVARELYQSPPLLWAIVPPILLWQCRLWLATGRNEMEDDPIVFSAKDWTSWVLGGLVVVAFVVALKSGIWNVAAKPPEKARQEEIVDSELPP